MLLKSVLTSGNPEIRAPEVSIKTMRQFPMLPSTSQKNFYTTPDATFNQGGSRTVLEHLEDAESTENFAYAEANRLGTQAAYLNVPHMTQKTICPLILPNTKRQAYGNEPFLLPFPHLRKGDIAFYLRLESRWEACRTDNASIPLSLVCKVGKILCTHVSKCTHTHTAVSKNRTGRTSSAAGWMRPCHEQGRCL